MTAVFEQHGLRIQYPENWKLEENQVDSKSLEVQLAAPSGAFWSLLVFERTKDFHQLMQECLKNIEEQYESMESNSISEHIGGFETSGHDTFFFYLDLLISNRMRCFTQGDFHFLIIWQAENREFDKLEPVFQAITIGFLAGLNESFELRLEPASEPRS